jgi:hypothetical protein
VPRTQSQRPIDAMIARLLYQLPLYQAWDEIQLPDEIKEVLDESDQQSLMCIVVYSLQQLMLRDESSQRSDCA